MKECRELIACILIAFVGIITFPLIVILVAICSIGELVPNGFEWINGKLIPIHRAKLESHKRSLRNEICAKIKAQKIHYRAPYVDMTYLDDPKQLQKISFLERSLVLEYTEVCKKLQSST